MTKEEIYDTEIAPALLEIMKKCKEHDMNILALVEYEPGETGSSVNFNGKEALPMRLAYAAIRSGMNMDILIGAIMDYARKNGHSSVYLHQLGVPLQP